MLFLMIGCVFIGSGAVGWSRRQIRMDAIVSLLPSALRQILEVIVELVEIAACFFLAALAWPVVSMLAELDQRSQAANFPLVIPQAAMPIGFALMAFLIAAALITRNARAGEPDDRPFEH
jgi:TRAP-type C4-dicarboxylate transport system permease small subunit